MFERPERCEPAACAYAFAESALVCRRVLTAERCELRESVRGIWCWRACGRQKRKARWVASRQLLSLKTLPLAFYELRKVRVKREEWESSNIV